MRWKLKRQCLQVLRSQFGLNGFRPGQEAAVSTLLSGRDLLCVLPTGAGKSLCWQLPAVMMAGRGWTLVVSPLIALMQDQVRHLNEKGVASATVNSLMTHEERANVMNRIRSGALRILFVSPERLQSDAFLSAIEDMPPRLLVVDEAHCIPQWGGTFREAYQGIGAFIRQLTKRPTICALTATADKDIRRAIIEGLGMRRCRQVTMPVFRENLRYEICTTSDKLREILLLTSQVQGRMVVFCRTRRRTEVLARQLCQRGISAAFYHAGMDRSERSLTQERFSAGEIAVLAATTAFGMGVDIPDIRCVIHDWLPESVVDYLQQAGRAGRDGLESRCVVMLDANDFMRIRQRFGRLRAQNMKHPVRRFVRVTREWRKMKAVLQIFLKDGCIASGLSRALGERHTACGCCSACVRGPLLHDRPIPPLHAMKSVDARAWMLRWQRDRLAQAKGAKPGSIMSGKELYRAAAAGALPERLKGEDASAFRRLLDTLRKTEFDSE